MTIVKLLRTLELAGMTEELFMLAVERGGLCYSPTILHRHKFALVPPRVAQLADRLLLRAIRAVDTPGDPYAPPIAQAPAPILAKRGEYLDQFIRSAEPKELAELAVIPTALWKAPA
jgi:hypothetical protein